MNVCIQGIVCINVVRVNVLSIHILHRFRVGMHYMYICIYIFYIIKGWHALYVYMYIYISIHMCIRVCVCVCVYVYIIYIYGKLI